MTQKITNGFPQYFSFTYLNGKYDGTASTEAAEDYTDINLQSDLIGDSITATEDEIELLTVMRDGAILLDGQGFEFIGTNQIRITPGLLENETVQIKKFTGVSGLIETVPVMPPVGSVGSSQTIQETDISQEVDVSGLSKLMVDTSLADIQIAGFIGGIEGQMLYIYNKNPINSFTLVFNSQTATQKVLLKGSTNYVCSNDYGGITLSFDDGIWREVSRS
jgi:hypothetical protein